MIVDIEKVEGNALDYLVAKAMWPGSQFPATWFITRPESTRCAIPSIDYTAIPITNYYPQKVWSIAGPILAQYYIFPEITSEETFVANLAGKVEHKGRFVQFVTTGATALTASLRCYVAWTLGEYTDNFSKIVVPVPDEFYSVD